MLEPSAGVGLLADGIKRSNDTLTVHCVELNQQCKDELIKKGHIVVGSDFFLFKSDTRYNCVIAAPNFRDNVDCDHVIKMYDHIMVGGRVVSIMSPTWMSGDSERQINFRKWLSNKKYHIEILPDFSYIEDDKTVPTIIVRIEK